MAKAIVTLIMFDERMYTGSGLVYRWMAKVTEEIRLSCIANAPVRTGELAGSILADTSQVALRADQGFVEATADHAKYVIGGTGTPKGVGYIYRDAARRAEVNRMLSSRSFFPGQLRGSKESQRGLWMKITDGGPMYHLRVRGQKPNNFMVDGYNAVAATHPALRRMGSRGGLL